MNREEIEETWQIVSNGFYRGARICSFVGLNHNLWLKWRDIWQDSDEYSIGQYFSGHPDINDLTYLTRALCLNMLLDDNEELI